jgi:hypothetical protein
MMPTHPRHASSTQHTEVSAKSGFHASSMRATATSRTASSVTPRRARQEGLEQVPEPVLDERSPTFRLAVAWRLSIDAFGYDLS